MKRYNYPESVKLAQLDRLLNEIGNMVFDNIIFLVQENITLYFYFYTIENLNV